jgi:hypothetical protein
VIGVLDDFLLFFSPIVTTCSKPLPNTYAESSWTLPLSPHRDKVVRRIAEVRKITEALQQVALESGTVVDPPVCAISYGSEISNAIVDYAKQQRAKLGVR